MGIEYIFFCMVAVFAVTGLVHGYKRELGVMIVLLLSLSVFQLTEGLFKSQFNAALTWVISSNGMYREAMRGVFYCLALVLVVFFAYQVDFLRFPGRGDTPFAPVLGMSTGLVNGYLLAGSMWYYLGHAGWPYLGMSGPFSQVYWSAWRMLPPQLLAWPILFLIGVSMLAVRVWKVA